MNTTTLPRQRRKPTCIIYVRLSRADDLSTSIKSQTDACRAFALSPGWRVLFVADQANGVSGGCGGFCFSPTTGRLRVGCCSAFDSQRFHSLVRLSQV